MSRNQKTPVNGLESLSNPCRHYGRGLSKQRARLQGMANKVLVNIRKQGKSGFETACPNSEIMGTKWHATGRNLTSGKRENTHNSTTMKGMKWHATGHNLTSAIRKKTDTVQRNEGEIGENALVSMGEGTHKKN